jgi:hypothetical protein
VVIASAAKAKSVPGPNSSLTFKSKVAATIRTRENRRSTPLITMKRLDRTKFAMPLMMMTTAA